MLLKVFWLRIQGWLTVLAIAALVAYCVRQQKRAEEEAKIASEKVCAVSVECQDERASFRSEFLQTDAPVQSTTGALFYKGQRCTSDCSGHVAGYRWAEIRGISKSAGCANRSQSFFEGCMIYAKERAGELETTTLEDDRPVECSYRGC